MGLVKKRDDWLQGARQVHPPEKPPPKVPPGSKNGQPSTPEEKEDDFGESPPPECYPPIVEYDD